MEALKLTPVDFNQDANFINQCLRACVEHLERHTTDNTVLSVLHLEDQVQQGTTQVFKGLADGKAVGMMILVLYPNGISEVQAVLLPDERKGLRALMFLHMMCDYAFNTLNQFKLKVQIKRSSRNPAEVISRRVGFKKEGLLKGEWNGLYQRGDALLLGYLKSDYEKDQAKKASNKAPKGMIEESKMEQSP